MLDVTAGYGGAYRSSDAYIWNQERNDDEIELKKDVNVCEISVIVMSVITHFSLGIQSHRTLPRKA